MHEFVMKIGYAVWNFFASIDPNAISDALSIVGIGMLGIFVVTGVIIAITALLNKLFSK